MCSRTTTSSPHCKQFEGPSPEKSCNLCARKQGDLVDLPRGPSKCRATRPTFRGFPGILASACLYSCHDVRRHQPSPLQSRGLGRPRQNVVVDCGRLAAALAALGPSSRQPRPGLRCDCSGAPPPCVAWLGMTCQPFIPCSFSASGPRCCLVLVSSRLTEICVPLFLCSFCYFCHACLLQIPSRLACLLLT